MQNPTHPPAAAGGNWAPVPNMYPTHQRSTSNPRAYPEAPVERREDYPPPPPPDQYPGYNYQYQQYNQAYNTPASGSRRTSGPKAATPPSASTYSHQYPSSAPPQVTAHHNISQPQTAHPYGGYYQYYDPQWYQQGQYRPPMPQVMDPYQYAPDRNWQRAPMTYPVQPAPYYPPNPQKKSKDNLKRPAEEEPEKKDKKKGKKEEEKPPKPPAKSHLHPPRQAQSAWQLFFTDELNKAKAAAQGDGETHAKLNVAQIAKDAGAAYATLNDEQKAYYAQKVQESKDQYAKDLAAWQKTLTPEDIRAENAFRAQQRKEGKSRKGNLKDPNAPKKPLSAYFLFLKGIREDDALRAKVWGEETETTKQSVLAAERWRALTDEEKRPYLSQAEKDKQDYEAARKVYEDDAAAKARGEDIPQREHFEAAPAHIEPPSSLKEAPLDFHIDDFHGFSDPLDGMDLSGLESIATDGHEGQWDELQKLMGDDKKEKSPKPKDEES